MNRIVFDTETANSLEQPLMYDLGYAVLDSEMKVIKTESLAIKEVINDSDLMSSAYYAEKLPKYFADIENGTRKLVSLATAINLIRNDIKKYGVNEVYAHNARFDDLCTKTTERYMTSSKYRYVFPSYVKMCDTLKMCRQLLGKNENYKTFCETNGFMTKHKTPRVRLTAEIVYRYITNDLEFVEEHQGLADVLIEKEILKYCLANGVVNGALWG